MGTQQEDVELAKQLQLTGIQAKSDSHEVSSAIRIIANNNTGYIYQIFRDYQEAISWYGRALALAREQNHTEQQMKALRGLGDVCELKGQVAEKVEFYKQASALEGPTNNA